MCIYIYIYIFIYTISMYSLYIYIYIIIFYSNIMKDRHVALTAWSAVKAAWRGDSAGCSITQLKFLEPADWEGMDKVSTTFYTNIMRELRAWATALKIIMDGIPLSATWRSSLYICTLATNGKQNNN